jgi:ubiquinone/menaquinone biosynthesis C-methylase UbiE
VFIGAFGIEPGQTVLELGCGTGFYSAEAARRVGPSGRLLCLDVQSEMLVEARRRVGPDGVSARYIQAGAHALPVPSESVDHVLLVTVLGEIPNRARGLLEMTRVLRPGGCLLVSEQFPDPDFVTIGRLRRELRAAGLTEERTKGRLWYTSTWRKPSTPPAEQAPTG